MVSGINPIRTQTIMGSRCLGCPALLAFASCLLTSGAYAQEICPEPVGRFASIEGEADVQSGGGGWRAAQLDQRLCEGDTIRVGERSRVAVQLINDAVLRVDQSTAYALSILRARPTSGLGLTL